MTRAINGCQLLKGLHGKPAVDMDTVERLLVSLLALALNHPEIKEMDINLLLVHAEGYGATVADCRMVLFDGAQG